MDSQGVGRNRTNSLSSNGSSGSSYGSASSPPSAEFFSGESPSSNDGIQQPPRRALLQDRSRHDSGGSIFQRRSDYSSFNVLPRHKINSYHIKVKQTLYTFGYKISTFKKNVIHCTNSYAVVFKLFRWKTSAALVMMRLGYLFYQVMLQIK